MNKKTVSQLSLFLPGFVSRMRGNAEFFKDITAELRSGSKTFKAVITNAADPELDYQAEKRKIAADDIAGFLCAEAAKYDSARIIYSERGARLTLTADERGAKMSSDSGVTDEPRTSVVQTGRDYVVNPALAKELLTEIGILAKNGKIKNDKIRKYNQIDYFAEIMGGVLSEIGERDEYTVLDAACGKSYLSFVLNFYFREVLKKKCRFTGVDYSQTVIDASRRIAKNLGYGNMEFVKADLNEYVPERAPDIVISLHACDTATDMAIALGIRSKARAIVCVPCCHKDILKQYSYEPFSMITKHGILKARLADTLTDGLRASYLEGRGYRVTLREYISPLETPKNIMIRAVYTGRRSERAMEEYEKLKRLINVSPAVERFCL